MVTERVLLRRHRVATMRRNGKRVNDIAAAMKVAERTIERDLNALRMVHPVRRLTAEDKALAGRLLDDGASITDVARTIGFHRTDIRWHFPNARPWTPAESATYGQLCRQMAAAP